MARRSHAQPRKLMKKLGPAGNRRARYSPASRGYKQPLERRLTDEVAAPSTQNSDEDAMTELPKIVYAEIPKKI